MQHNSNSAAEIRRLDDAPRTAESSAERFEAVVTSLDGPRIARIGVSFVALLASTVLIFSFRAPGPYFPVTLWFYSGELALQLVILCASFSDAFRRRWEEFILVDVLIVTAGIAIASISAGSFRSALMGLLLLQLGTAATLPWQPRKQLWVGLASLACLGLFTALTPQALADAFSNWVVLITASATAQVAAVAAYSFRTESKNRTRAALQAQRRLAEEVRQRERLIADLEETQRRLQASESTLRSVFDAIPEFIVVQRIADDQSVLFNQALRSAGFTAQELQRRNRTPGLSWVNEAEREEFLRLRDRPGGLHNMEAQFLDAQGAKIDCLISSIQVEIEREACRLHIIRDVTQFKKVHRLIEENQAAVERFFEATDEAIAVIDVETRQLVRVNPAFEQFTGWKQAQALGHSARELGLLNEPDEGARIRELLSENRILKNIQVRLRARDGTLKYGLLSATIVKINDRYSIVMLARDITELKHATERLERNARTIKAVFDVSLSAIAVLRASDGRCLLVNEEFVRATGLAQADVIGRTALEMGIFCNEQDRDRVLAALSKDGKVRNLEVDFRGADGIAIPSLLSAALVEVGGEMCIVAFARDITALKETQRQLVAAREDALAASRAKSEFLSSMSHEIRTPMNSVLGNAELLADTELSLEQRHHVEMIRNNGAMLLELINSILDLAQVESGRLSLDVTAFELCDLVEKAVDTVAVKAHEKNLELLARFSRDLPESVVGDALRLRQILVNLLSNAIKFTALGEVILTVEPAHSAAGALIRFSVTDTGIGIAREKLSQVFEPFTQADSTTRRAYGGSGLGLAIVQRLAALMQGEVTVQSTPDQGSTFTLTVPLAAAEDGTRARNDELRGATILLVEAHLKTRETLASILEARGATITAVASLEEATDAIRQQRSNGRDFDVVLLDSALSSCTASAMKEVSLRLGIDLSHLVLMLTTVGIGVTTRSLAATGVGAFVVKPIKRSELLEATRMALGLGKAPAPTDHDASHRVVVKPAPERSIRVLLVDDTADNRLLIRRFLRDGPYEVEEGENGREAVEKLAAGTYDLVLMDMRMPVMDGYQAVSAIRQWEKDTRHRHTPIIALTASALDEDVRRTAEVGCDLHLPKPVSRGALLAAMGTILGR